VALFNAGDAAAAVSVEARDAGLPAGGQYCARDLWAQRDAGKVVQGVLAADRVLGGAFQLQK